MEEGSYDGPWERERLGVTIGLGKRSGKRVRMDFGKGSAG